MQSIQHYHNVSFLSILERERERKREKEREGERGRERDGERERGAIARGKIQWEIERGERESKRRESGR